MSMTESLQTMEVPARPEQRAACFIAWLYRLARERGMDGPQGADARQALAELRAGLRFTPESRLQMARHVVPFLAEQPSREDRWFYIISALFAMATEQRKERQGVSMGGAFGELWRQKERSDSIEGRFLALVNSRPEHLPVHLRAAVSLLDSNEIELDWFRLMNDLFAWGHPERIAQARWLRDFYGATDGWEAIAEDDSSASTPDDFEGETNEN